MTITKTRTVLGVLYHAGSQEIALVVAVGHGLHNVMPNARLVQRIGAQARCCLGLVAAELFVQVLAAEWQAHRA